MNEIYLEKTKHIYYSKPGVSADLVSHLMQGSDKFAEECFEYFINLARAHNWKVFVWTGEAYWEEVATA